MEQEKLKPATITNRIKKSFGMKTSINMKKILKSDVREAFYKEYNNRVKFKANMKMAPTEDIQFVEDFVKSKGVGAKKLSDIFLVPIGRHPSALEEIPTEEEDPTEEEIIKQEEKVELIPKSLQTSKISPEKSSRQRKLEEVSARMAAMEKRTEALTERSEKFKRSRQQRKEKDQVINLFEEGVVNDLNDVKLTVVRDDQWSELDEDRDGRFNTSSLPNPESIEHLIQHEVVRIEEDEEKETEDALPEVIDIPAPGPPPPPIQQGLDVGLIPGVPIAGLANLVDPATGRRLEQIGGPVDPPEESRSFIPTAVGAIAAGGMAMAAGAGPLGIAGAGGLAILNDQIARRYGWSDWRSATAILGNRDILRLAQRHMPIEYVRLANSTMRIATDENPGSAMVSLLINGYETVQRLIKDNLMPEEIDVSKLFLSREEFGKMAFDELKTVGEIGAKELMRGIGKEVGNSIARSFQPPQPDVEKDLGTKQPGTQKLPSMDMNNLTWNRDFGPWSTLLKDAQTDFEDKPIEDPPRPEEILYGHGQLRPDKKYLGSRSLDGLVMMPSKVIARSRNYDMFPDSSPYDINPIPLYDRVSMDSIQRQQDFKALVRPCKARMLVGLS